MERVLPTATSDRICQNVTDPPTVSGIDRVFSVSIPSSGAEGVVILTFNASSNSAANRRLDISLSGPDSAALNVDWIDANGLYTISLALSANQSVLPDVLRFTLSIRDARPVCYIAGVELAGGCEYRQDITLAVGRAICPSDQYHVLSDGQLAVDVNWADPTPISIPGVMPDTPHNASLSKGPRGRGRYEVTLSWPNVIFSVGRFNVSCSFHVSAR
jgi:hypothetical protein